MRVGFIGQGEKRIPGASQEVVDIFSKISYNLNSVCKTGLANTLVI
jgi:hypothetical protein